MVDIVPTGLATGGPESSVTGSDKQPKPEQEQRERQVSREADQADGDRGRRDAGPQSPLATA